jgi:hypothetical protein
MKRKKNKGSQMGQTKKKFKKKKKKNRATEQQK